MQHLDRISIDPEIRFGKPCVRGTRITVGEVLGYLAAGGGESELLIDFPQLTHEDLLACFGFAAERERRLLQPLAELFPGSEHIRNLTNTGTSDRLLWDLARTGRFILTTRDEDFVGMSVLRGAPPKVVWLNVGKSRNAVIAALLQTHASDIERFAEHDEHTFLAIGFYTAATSR